MKNITLQMYADWNYSICVLYLVHLQMKKMDFFSSFFLYKKEVFTLSENTSAC